MLCEESSAFKLLFNDSHRIFQIIIAALRLEQIDPVYYDIVVRNVITAAVAQNNKSNNSNGGGSRQYKFDLNKMIIRPSANRASTLNPDILALSTGSSILKDGVTGAYAYRAPPNVNAAIRETGEML